MKRPLKGDTTICYYDGRCTNPNCPYKHSIPPGPKNTKVYIYIYIYILEHTLPPL